MWKHGEITSALLSITLITFANEAAVDNAELACRKNRVGIMLLFLVRFEYQELIDPKAIRQFRANIVSTIEQNSDLKTQTTSSDAIERLEEYSARR